MEMGVLRSTDTQDGTYLEWKNKTKDKQYIP